MRISLNWLRELVALDGSAQELAERLTLAGFEVEDIEDRSTWADGVVVGKVLVRDKHPNADKLSVCQVDIGQDEPSTIVCGAPNVQAGLFVPVATLGTYLPNVDLKIKPAKLRGVPSAGMICSLSELGLTKDSEGIHVFDPKQQSFKVGDDVRPLLGLDDAILDLSSTANRADALSMVGIAREVAALQGTSQIDLPKIPNLKIPTKGPAIAIEVDDAQACPAYIATRLDGIKVAPSPEWLKRHLEAAGTRPINNVVDITNYILLEWGQPLHAFDADALSAVAGGSSLTLGVRFAKTGETLKTLDGQGRSLSPQNLLITANEHPIALAGVMGGEETEVRETTTSIVLEAALFSSISVRRSARAQGLRSEASTRYERGVNETQLDLACRHAVALLQELAGGKLVAQNIADSRTPQQRSIELRLSRINQLLGPLEGPDDESLEELTGEQVTQLLESLGFIPTPTDKSDVWNVEVPPHRHRDIEREIDLIEEVARLHGYDKFCDTLPSKTEPGYLAADDVIIRQIREAFRANGLTELIHYTWTKPGEDDSHQIQVSNPLLVEFSALRTEMLTELLTAFQYNLEQGNGPLNGFEIGRIFWKEEDGLAEAHALAGIVSGKPLQGKWLTAKKDTMLSWFEAKGILEGVFQRLDIAVEYQPDRQDTRLHPGRTASLWIEGERLGRFGQIHPQLRQERDLPEDVYGFELDLEVLVSAIDKARSHSSGFKPFSLFPASDRDLAFFVETHVSVTELERVMRKAATTSNGSLLSSIELFDEYRGEHVPAGQRSLAFRLVYRADDRTLTDDEVNPVHQKVRDALEDRFRVSLRS
jgi:phenylalanyl-tRNA synthetase beta chain